VSWLPRTGVLDGTGAVARSGRPSRVLSFAAAAIAMGALLATSRSVRAQSSATVPATPSIVDGRVLRPKSTALNPVAGVWVTIHRVSSDTAGPLDSMRTGANGRFHFRYTRGGKADAVYFASAMYDGIAYFSRPLTSASVTGADAEIVVYDTTSVHFPLAVKGRHIVVASPSIDGSRQIVEAYEIENESDRTLISPDDAHPSWSAPLPPGASNLQVGESDVSAAAIVAVNGRVLVSAPFAPGLKQLSYSYSLPQKSFPLHVPLEQPATVLELLLEEPKAQARGATLKPVAPATVEGRVFQRYLGADAPAGASIEIEVPVIHAAADARVYWEIAAALAALMALGILGWFLRMRRGRVRATPRSAARGLDATETLARAIASLDAEFEKVQAPDASAREAYDHRRRALKRELTNALDASAHST
jgi:hypothetical protein